MSIDAVIAAAQALPDHPGRFAHSSAYPRLQTEVFEHMCVDSEVWPANLLIRSAIDLGRCPTHIADEPSGVDMLAEHLGRIGQDRT